MDNFELSTRVAAAANRKIECPLVDFGTADQGRAGREGVGSCCESNHDHVGIAGCGALCVAGGVAQGAAHGAGVSYARAA